jgi:asparagine synthase (glutamine-hydrolysing)
MCGIFGILSPHPVDPEKVVRVSRMLAHRGPDDEGFLLFHPDSGDFQSCSGRDTVPEIRFPAISQIQKHYTAAFCHRRLSIIDLTPKGHQPISYDRENLWIILNGEIYNHPEIRDELIRKGYSFHSTSDTEVAVAAYREWGEQCVERFNGMWAFAVWDRAAKKIFLSRDRFGVKPLYYYFHQGIFMFSSEIKGIREYLSANLTLNSSVFFKYALRGEVRIGEDDQTMFSDIRQVMPGNNLVFSGNSIRQSAYWALSRKPNKLSIGENVEQFRNLFRSSIALRLRSDVEVGSCLSGGLDSSSIVSFGSAVFNKRFHTFSAVWPGETCDESFYIRKVNELYRCHAHPFTPRFDDIIALMERLVWHQEIPLPGPSILAQWAVMEKARQNRIKVLLDGQGGDETLGGYIAYLATYIREMFFRGKWITLLQHRESLKSGKIDNIKKLVWCLFRKNLRQEHPIIPLTANFGDQHSFEEVYLKTRYNLLNDFLATEIQVSSLPSLLHYEDRNSMAHGVEARVPFLDYRLVEFALNIPAEQKMQGSFTKTILRQAMQDYLPKEILTRTDKIGFDTPVEKLHLSPNGQFHRQIWDYIESSALPGMELVDLARVRKSDWKWINFAVLSMAVFMNKFLR